MSDSKNGKLTNIDELITEIDINKENDRIEIVDVFDTRQNPISIKRSK
jgi:hypothetical protein